MTYERFTDRARKTFRLALSEAHIRGSESVDTPHLLLGILREGSGVACNILRKLGVDMDKFLLQVRNSLSCSDRVTSGRLPQTLQLKKVVEVAISLSRTFNHNYIGTEHLLSALLVSEHQPIAGDLIFNLLSGVGVTFPRVRDAILEMTKALPASGEESEKPPEEMSTRILHLTPNLSVLVPIPPKKVRLEKPPEEMNYERERMLEVMKSTPPGKWSEDPVEFVRALWNRLGKGMDFNWGMGEEEFSKHALRDLEELGFCMVWRRDEGSFQGLWILNPAQLLPYPPSRSYTSGSYLVDSDKPYCFFIRAEEVEKIIRPSPPAPTLEEVIATLTPEEKQDLLNQIQSSKAGEGTPKLVTLPHEVEVTGFDSQVLLSPEGKIQFHRKTKLSCSSSLPLEVLSQAREWVCQNVQVPSGYKRIMQRWETTQDGLNLIWYATDEEV